MPYVIRAEGLVLQGDNGKEPVFHTYEEVAETLKALTSPQFPKYIRRKPFKPKIIKIADSK